MTMLPLWPAAAHVSHAHGELRAVGLRWRHDARWIVDGVDLTAIGGEIVGLLGPNGAGKTVTLSMIAGLVEPTSGRVFVNGVDVTEMPLYMRARMGLGYLPQERSVFRQLTAKENIDAVLAGRVGHEEMDRRRDALIERFDLKRVADVAAFRLSGGEQRRLEVARSLALNPTVMLFDEPFAGIDPLTIESLHRMLVDLRRSKVAVVLTDHNVVEALTLCDRAYVLCDGRILRHGTPAELMANDEVRQRFLGPEFKLVAVTPPPTHEVAGTP